MNRTGVPLIQSLKIIGQFDQVIEKIGLGNSLGNSLRGLLPDAAVGAIAGAERSGSLDEVLAQLAEHYERLAETESKVKSALIYPFFVMTLSLLIISSMIFFVLPAFKTIVSDTGAQLPFLTGVIFTLSDWAGWLITIILIGGSIVALVFFRRKDLLEKILLRSSFVTRGETIGFCRALGQLLEGGVPLLEALDKAVLACRYDLFRAAIARETAKVADGESLSETLARAGLVPRETCQLVAVAENSGRLGKVLLRAAELEEKRQLQTVKKFTSLLEPALTLGVGLVVGSIVLAMFLPLMNIVSVME